MQSALFQRLEEILQRHFMVEADLLRANRYLEDLGLTQPEKKELFNLFEEEFHICLTEQDERSIRTVYDTVSVLKNCLRSRPALQTIHPYNYA
jgi:hypothetical protein